MFVCLVLVLLLLLGCALFLMLGLLVRLVKLGVRAGLLGGVPSSSGAGCSTGFPGSFPGHPVVQAPYQMRRECHLWGSPCRPSDAFSATGPKEIPLSGIFCSHKQRCSACTQYGSCMRCRCSHCISKMGKMTTFFYIVLLSVSDFGSRGRRFRLSLWCSSCRRQTTVAKSLAKAIRRLRCPRACTSLKSSSSIPWVAGKGGKYLESSTR